VTFFSKVRKGERDRGEEYHVRVRGYCCGRKGKIDLTKIGGGKNPSLRTTREKAEEQTSSCRSQRRGPCGSLKYEKVKMQVQN